MLSFFILESLWWWVAFSAFGVCEIVGGLKENGWINGLGFGAYFLAMWLFFDIPIWSAIYNNPLVFLSVIVLYPLFGVLWSSAKWYWACSDYVKECKERDERTKEKNPEHFRSRPLAKNNKSDLIYWVAYWPLSMLFFFFEDFLTRIFTAIVDKFQNIYSRIENKVYSQLNN